MMLPNNKPRMTRQDVEKELAAFKLEGFPVIVLGIRGYYAKSMGPTPGNDRGIYDDAMFIVSPDTFAAFNANTDPNIHRKGIATLVAPQVVFYKVGMHGISGSNPRQAFRQDSFGIRVSRDSSSVVHTDSAKAPFWINIHDGGINTTSSEGCQTLPKSQWPAFNELLKAELERNAQKRFPYVLIEYK